MSTAKPAFLDDFNIPVLSKIAIGIFLLLVGIAAWTNHIYLLLVPIVIVIGIIPFYNLRLFFWFFILTIPLSAEITLPGGAFSLALPDEPLMALSLLLIFFLLIKNYLVFPTWFWKNSIFILLMLQLAWLIVTVILAEQHFVSIKFLLAKCWFLASYIFLPILILKEKKDFKKLALILAIPIILHAGVAATWHYFEYFDYHRSNYVVLPFYKNHVDYGSVLSVMIPLIYICYLQSKGNRRMRIFLSFVMIFLLFAIYIAFSRAAILAFIFAFGVLFMIRIRLVNIVMPIFLGIVAVALFFLINNNTYLDYSPDINKNATQKTFKETVTGVFTGEDMSSMERFYRWIASIRMSEERPIAGVGPNNWYEYYKPHAVASYKTWVSRNEERSTTHNYFLFTLTEQGWPGMLLYAALIILLFAKGQQIYYRFTDLTYKRYTLVAVATIAATFINNFFSEFLETHKVGGLFYLAIAALIILDQKSKELELADKAPVSDSKIDVS